MTKLGLRIDVDTFRGTKIGVPNLCKILEKHNVKASFFFSVGPDNMGRHIWRLIKPDFLFKMLRTKAKTLYGWDILFKGTFWPGPMIGKKLAHIIRKTSDLGHEIGFHAWDHQQWQTRLEKMNNEEIYFSLKKGMDVLTDILGYSPQCSAAPAWMCNDCVILEKTKFNFLYNSDCRGTSIFLPLINGQKNSQPQIPTTLPTYDEVIYQNGITNENYNEYILSLIKEDALNILTIHAEAEGIVLAKMFENFILMAKEKNIEFVPLSSFLSKDEKYPVAKIIKGQVAGREGVVSLQSINIPT